MMRFLIAVVGNAVAEFHRRALHYHALLEAIMDAEDKCLGLRLFAPLALRRQGLH
jgi:hypothetical protein